MHNGATTVGKQTSQPSKNYTHKLPCEPGLHLCKEIEFDEGFDLCCGFFHCVFKCPGGKAESELLTPSGEGLSLTTWSKRNNH